MLFRSQYKIYPAQSIGQTVARLDLPIHYHAYPRILSPRIQNTDLSLCLVFFNLYYSFQILQFIYLSYLIHETSPVTFFSIRSLLPVICSHPAEFLFILIKTLSRDACLSHPYGIMADNAQILIFGNTRY